MFGLSLLVMCAMVILGAGPSQRADTSGSRPGPPDANGSSSGGGGGGGVPPERRNGADARSMQELQEAAEWQLQRARAELRRAVEAQVRVDKEMRYRPRKSVAWWACMGAAALGFRV